MGAKEKSYTPCRVALHSLEPDVQVFLNSRSFATSAYPGLRL